MPGDPGFGGLCPTCKNAAACALSGDHQRRVWFCELYEPTDPPGGASVGESVHIPTVVQEADPTRYKGLCEDCMYRETCMFMKPEGGVWHCEQYR